MRATQSKLALTRKTRLDHWIGLDNLALIRIGLDTSRIGLDWLGLDWIGLD